MIEIWTARVEDWEQPEAVARLQSVLDAEEREQTARFMFEKDRAVYRLAHGMLRLLLSELLVGKPEEWQFVRGAHGRPALVNAQRGELEFNLSHTTGAAVVAFGRGLELGVDIERLGRKERTVKTVMKGWSERERQDLATKPAAEMVEYFLRVWTLKEAYIKARGMGLVLPIDKFSITLADDDRIHFDAEPEVENEPHAWRFWQSRALTEYVMALAWRGNECPVVVRPFTFSSRASD